MIQLRINEEILKKHEEFIFGTNSKKDNRIYQKLISVKRNETDKYARNVYAYILDNLRHIVLGEIQLLSKIKGVYNYLVNSIPNKTVRERVKIKLKIFHQEYEYFYRSVGWNAYLYQKALDVTICPYCATQFIFVYESDNGNTRGTLDHFIDKATYPIFSISLYNLIPSCKVCNLDFKGKKEMDISEYYTPFEEGIVDHIVFKREIIQKQDEEISPTAIIELKKVNKEAIDFVSMFLGINDDFNIKADYSSAPKDIADKIKGNLKLFNIEEIYNAYHKKYVQDSIRKAYIYNHTYRAQLLNSFDNFFQSEEELKLAIMPNDEEDRKNILGKLTRDIVIKETRGFTL